ncbi:MAG: hypothetical protein AB7O24_32965, partial [Kofleriaceae bacterium]
AMRNIIQSGGEWFAEAQRRVQSILPGKRKDGSEPEIIDAVDDDDATGKKRLAALREWVESSKHRLDEWQKHVDSKIRSAIEGMSPLSGVNKDVRALADRIAELETKLRALDHEHDSPDHD